MLDSALGWVGQVAEWMGNFIPRWYILDTTEGAVKFVRGKPHNCEPGRIHWIWPVLTKISFYPVARQTDRLETQTIVSKDNRTFIVSGTITYEVADLMKLVPTTHSPQTAVCEMAMTAIADECCEFTLDELLSMQRKGTLKTRLRNEAQKQLTDYGVRVIQFRLNSLAPCRVLRLSQAMASEEN